MATTTIISPLNQIGTIEFPIIPYHQQLNSLSSTLMRLLGAVAPSTLLGITGGAKHAAPNRDPLVFKKSRREAINFFFIAFYNPCKRWLAIMNHVFSY